MLLFGDGGCSILLVVAEADVVLDGSDGQVVQLLFVGLVVVTISELVAVVLVLLVIPEIAAKCYPCEKCLKGEPPLLIKCYKVHTH